MPAEGEQMEGGRGSSGQQQSFIVCAGGKFAMWEEKLNDAEAFCYIRSSPSSAILVTRAFRCCSPALLIK